MRPGTLLPLPPQFRATPPSPRPEPADPEAPDLAGPPADPEAGAGAEVAGPEAVASPEAPALAGPEAPALAGPPADPEAVAPTDDEFAPTDDEVDPDPDRQAEDPDLASSESVAQDTPGEADEDPDDAEDVRDALEAAARRVGLYVEGMTPVEIRYALDVHSIYSRAAGDNDEFAELEERAAIIEYDGGLPRWQAEALAVGMLAPVALAA